jgi:ribosomal protein S18 acetylase RimI-like enzyme
MNEIKIIFVPEAELNTSQKELILKLQKECFSDVDRQSIEEDFIAKSFARIFALKGGEIVGMLSLFKRNIIFSGKKIILGGLGGACVAEEFRRRGVATRMLKKGLEILRQERCDIVCLNADLEKQAYKLYEKVGFKLMKRRISFENSKGKIKFDTGTMFTPVCSKQIYDFVMKSKKTFHYGRGYW